MTSKRPIAALVPLLLALAVAGGGCSAGCPLALLEGTLEARNGELVVAQQGGGPPERVDWPAGYRVEARGGVLWLVDLVGSPKVREGDFVSLGGGEVTAGIFKVCGRLETQPMLGSR